eukprot:gene13469-9277_t
MKKNEEGPGEINHTLRPPDPTTDEPLSFPPLSFNVSPSHPKRSPYYEVLPIAYRFAKGAGRQHTELPCVDMALRTSGIGARIWRRTPLLLFGAGGTKGGVKRISLSEKGYETYKNWALSEPTRKELGSVHHVLIPEYLIRLDEKRRRLEKWLEVHAGDPSGQAEFTNANGTPFDYVAWNRKYRDELDAAVHFASLATRLDESMSLMAGLKKGKGDAGDTSAASPSLTADEEERKELLGMVEQDIRTLLDEIRAMDDQVERVMSRRLQQEDVLGSSTKTWHLTVAGKAGGTEANLFAGELAEVLRGYCTMSHGWKASSSSSEQGNSGSCGGEDGIGAPSEEGIRITVRGDGVYRFLHHEIGVHKVQRVPVTDAAGKMQTSTAVVKLTPLLDPVSVQVYESDCKIDFVRGSGPGGQGMQSSSNCVVLTHKPSGITVKCHQSRSALGNKELALQMVAQQLLAKRAKGQNSSLYEAWNSQWSSGERSDKMRTYNYPQNRVTDHRLGKDYPLSQFMEGSGQTLRRLHDELNQISDAQELSAALLKHINSDFDSDESQ